MKKLYFLIVTSCLTFSACSHPEKPSLQHIDNIQIESGLLTKNAYIPYRSDTQEHFAAYFDLENTTDNSLTIINAYSPAFAHVMLHETIIEDGMAKMKHIESLTLNTGDIVQFKPKGKHVMLMQPQQDLSTMHGIYLILELANGQKLKYDVNFKKSNN